MPNKKFLSLTLGRLVRARFATLRTRTSLPLKHFNLAIEVYKKNPTIKIEFSGPSTLFDKVPHLGHSNMMITAKKYAYLVDEYKAKLRMLWTILAGQQLDNKMTFINFR